MDKIYNVESSEKLLAIQVMEVDEPKFKGWEKITPKRKSPKDMEADHKLKEILIHTRKILEIEEKQSRLNEDEKTMLELF